MNTCKTCKYWEPYARTLGKCHKLNDRELPKYQTVVVFGDSEPIETGMDFGCIHHFQKPEVE